MLSVVFYIYNFAYVKVVEKVCIYIIIMILKIADSTDQISAGVPPIPYV